MENANSENSLVILFRTELNEAADSGKLKIAAEKTLQRYPLMAIRLYEKGS